MSLKEIATRTPPDLSPLKTRKKELSRFVNQHTSEHLKNTYKFLYGKTTTKNKFELIEAITDFLSFPAEEQFREWFFNLSEPAQKILHKAAFTDVLILPKLEKEWGISLVQKKEFYWKIEWQFKPELNLDSFRISAQYNCPVTAIPGYLQEVLKVWLVPPVLSQLSGCRAEKTGEAWDNSLSIADSFPLLCDALQNSLEGMIGDNDLEKLVRNGFKKKEINELRASSGFLPFRMENDSTPFSVDVAARFVLCMQNFKPLRPQDGQEGIRNMVQAFFSEKSQYPKRWYSPDRAFLEYSICIDHLSRTPGYYLENNDELPSSRKVLYDILLHIAGDGNWFDADKLADYIRITGKDFSFCDRSLESTFKVKADTYKFEGLTLEPGYDDFHPDGILRFYLLVRPLFKAYCYILAALGLLEITQLTPPLVRNYREKQYPFSLYDSLKAIRVTELGRWCLGVSDKRPPKPSQEYQAIADRELLLVTVQGNSLERRVYLDKIGQRLGEDRWRISPASFISGCINQKQIAARIERFKMLIDPNPAPHWEQLFKKVIDRAGLFDTRRSDILIFNLPADREIQEELLRDPEIKRVVRRVEGRMLAVSVRNQAKFYALLGEHGIAHLEC